MTETYTILKFLKQNKIKIVKITKVENIFFLTFYRKLKKKMTFFFKSYKQTTKLNKIFIYIYFNNI